MHKDMETAKRLENERINACRPLPPFRLVSDSERNEIINVRITVHNYFVFFLFFFVPFLRYHLNSKCFTQALITKMEKLYTEFLLLPMITETIQMVKRKTMLERTLKDMEKNIDLLVRRKVLYVSQDA